MSPLTIGDPPLDPYVSTLPEESWWAALAGMGMLAAIAIVSAPLLAWSWHWLSPLALYVLRWYLGLFP